jgi:hypothetical protein
MRWAAILYYIYTSLLFQTCLFDEYNPECEMCRWLRWTCGTFYGLLVLDFPLNHDIQRLETR